MILPLTVLRRCTRRLVDHTKTKIGFEIPFNRHFYVYEPPRPLEEIDADLQELEHEIVGLLAEVTE